MWLRLETGAHIRENFAAMRKSGVQTMFRGHDHFVAMRSHDAKGRLYGHDVVINELRPDGPRYRTHSSRRNDEVDAVESAAGVEVSALGDRNDFHWTPLHPRRRHVINFGPYFAGYFGLVRTAHDNAPPAVAFCRIETSHYNAADRAELLGDTSLGARARAGTNFYDLFRRN